MSIDLASLPMFDPALLTAKIEIRKRPAFRQTWDIFLDGELVGYVHITVNSAAFYLRPTAPAEGPRDWQATSDLFASDLGTQIALEVAKLTITEQTRMLQERREAEKDG
jgi:hypothetical protein